MILTVNLQLDRENSSLKLTQSNFWLLNVKSLARWNYFSICTGTQYLKIVLSLDLIVVIFKISNVHIFLYSDQFRGWTLRMFEIFQQNFILLQGLEGQNINSSSIFSVLGRNTFSYLLKLSGTLYRPIPNIPKQQIRLENLRKPYCVCHEANAI